jgi:radical SAM modification target selenobiotic family peptide
MDAKDLKKYLAGLGIAGLLTGTSLMAAETPAAGGKTEGTAKTAPTESALKSEQTKTAPAKSG